ncbi:Hypothetical protein CINCED_3A018090 [Cinara cedri]|uniref:Uncharacterized protein n=1 Tax=Cinara cedri TaxID=506608 RepID=A0A5E4LZR4_9HEMI|nr:Hypothetical protein CINCED_3A018090 [Cinara cedri]
MPLEKKIKSGSVTGNQKQTIIDFMESHPHLAKGQFLSQLPMIEIIFVLLYDEAHFWLNGYVNKQIDRIWTEEQPEEVQKLPLHPDKITVWCGLWAGGIIAHEILALSREQFGEQLISRFRPISWPARSCDITPLDIFLWSYVRSKVYITKPTMIDELEANIKHVIGKILVEMLEWVIENWNFRMDHVRRSSI